MARLPRFVTEHWTFVVLIVIAAALRGLAWFAIHPAWWFLGDSIGYIWYAVDPRPDEWRPSGYSLLVLWPLLPAHRIALVTVVQHLMGLGVGAMVYVTLRRLGIAHWWAALAAAPVLLDGYVIASEQMLVSEPVFALLVVGAISILLWRGVGPGHLAVATAGLLLGLAAVTRIVGLPLAAVAILALLVRRAGWTRVAALGIAAALPICAYAAWFDHQYGRLGLTDSNGRFLYGQATQFVDCSRMEFSEERLRRLCPTEPIGSRNEFFYIFDGQSPLVATKLDFAGANDLGGRFAMEAIRAQPGGYAALIGDGLLQSFHWDRGPYSSDLEFRAPEPMNETARHAGYLYQGRDPGPIYRIDLVRMLAAYQRFAWVPGFACLIALVLAAAGLVFGKDPTGRGLHSGVLLTAGTGIMLIALPVATTIIIGSMPRYRVPAIPILSLSCALSIRLLLNRWTVSHDRRPGRSALEPQPS
jgi:hypothetical protein